MKNTDYTPINCSFYDELERVTTLKKKVKIEYRNELGKAVGRTCRIANLRTEKGEEFLIDENGWELRLDHLISVDGKRLTRGYCGI